MGEYEELKKKITQDYSIITSAEAQYLIFIIEQMKEIHGRLIDKVQRDILEPDKIICHLERSTHELRLLEE